MDCIRRIQDLIIRDREEKLFKAIKNEFIKTLSQRGYHFNNNNLEDLYDLLRTRVELVTFSRTSFGQTKSYLLDGYDELFSITENNDIISFRDQSSILSETTYKIVPRIK